MPRAFIAGSAYVLALFALGFVLGAVRVTLVIPRTGTLCATALEIPLMLAGGTVLCRWSVRHWQVRPSTAPRLAMVLAYLVLLPLLEATLGLLFGRTLADQWAALATPAGRLGASAQFAAALLPLGVARGSAQLQT